MCLHINKSCPIHPQKSTPMQFTNFYDVNKILFIPSKYFHLIQNFPPLSLVKFKYWLMEMRVENYFMLGHSFLHARKVTYEHFRGLGGFSKASKKYVSCWDTNFLNNVLSGDYRITDFNYFNSVIPPNQLNALGFSHLSPAAIKQYIDSIGIYKFWVPLPSVKHV